MLMMSNNKKCKYFFIFIFISIDKMENINKTPLQQINHNISDDDVTILNKQRANVVDIVINNREEQLNPQYEDSISLKKLCENYVSDINNIDNDEYKYRSTDILEDSYKSKQKNNKYSNEYKNLTNKLNTQNNKLSDKNIGRNKVDKYKKLIEETKKEIKSKKINSSFNKTIELQPGHSMRTSAMKIDKSFNDQIHNIFDRDIQRSNKQGLLSDLQSVIYQDNRYVLKSDIDLDKYKYVDIRNKKNLIIYYNDGESIKFDIRNDFYLDSMKNKKLDKYKEYEDISDTTKFIKIDVDALVKIASYDLTSNNEMNKIYIQYFRKLNDENKIEYQYTITISNVIDVDVIIFIDELKKIQMKIKHSEYFTHNYANELKSLVNELDINTYDEQIKKIET